MRKGLWWFAIILTAAATLHSMPVAAQESSFDVEIAPYAAYRFGGQFDEIDGDRDFELNDSNAFGITASFRAHPNGQYELLYGRQETEVDTQGLFVSDPLIDMDVEYFQFGGAYVGDGDKVRPFIALTAGVTHFDPQPAEFSSENFFSTSFGAGVQLNTTKRIGARIEGRVYATFLDSDSDIFCQSIGGAGSCLIQVDATVLTQWEARAGLVFRF